MTLVGQFVIGAESPTILLTIVGGFIVGHIQTRKEPRVKSAIEGQSVVPTSRDLGWVNDDPRVHGCL